MDLRYNATNLLALEKMEEDTDGPPPATKEMAVVGMASNNATVGTVPSLTTAGETTAGTVPPDGTAKAESNESSTEFNMITKL